MLIEVTVGVAVFVGAIACAAMGWSRLNLIEFAVAFVPYTYFFNAVGALLSLVLFARGRGAEFQLGDVIGHLLNWFYVLSFAAFVGWFVLFELSQVIVD